MGILSLMYHRFDEEKYPSTNIKMNVFKDQIQIIKNLNYDFYDPGDLEKTFDIEKKEKKILITIDDAFSSFYNTAWPYLKKEKIPFILFVSTETVGKNGYMTWSQLKELEKYQNVYIGNHSHSHDYLVNFEKDDFINDIKTAIWLLEETPQLVFAISGKLNHEFDDFATTLLGFKDNKTVVISSNWIKSKRNRNLELVCTNDKVSITNDDWNVSLDNSTFNDNATNIAEAAFLSSQKGIPIYLDLK